MKRSFLPRTSRIVLSLCVLLTAAPVFSATIPRAARPQYDDPYADFRSARSSNSGLLGERDEIKLGTQLHRAVPKRFRLTHVGVERVERIGQRCARASLPPNLLYNFHVVQSRD